MIITNVDVINPARNFPANMDSFLIGLVNSSKPVLSSYSETKRPDQNMVTATIAKIVINRRYSVIKSLDSEGNFISDSVNIR